MSYISDIIHFVEDSTGHKLNRDEGLQYGEGDCTLQGATVAWMATPDAIQAAGEAGHQLLIAHESVFFPYDVLNAPDAPKQWREWKVNKQRIAALNQYDLSCLRLHGSVDEICIFDTFAELLDLGKPVFVDGLVKIYEILPCPLHALVQHVKERLGMKSLRIAGINNTDPIVSRIGLPWGGLGLFVNVGYQQQLIARECDVFIAGESDNYGFRFAVEAGVPMIETSHELSENPGLRRFTDMLQQAFPDVQFSFYENACIWRVV